MNRPLLFAALAALALAARPLRAADAAGARPGIWTYDTPAARQLADTTDRPLLVMFSNTRGDCHWCNRFEREINASPVWQAYASEQLLALAFINYAGPNWDPDYYQNVYSNQAEITAFPAFLLYASDGATVLSAFTFTTNFTFNADTFVGQIDAALEANDYLVEGQDIWDPADNSDVGATVLEFRDFNQRQYHDLNEEADDTDDWFKFLHVRNRRYMLKVPASDYRIDFTATVPTNQLTAVTNQWPAFASTNAAALAAVTNRLTLSSGLVTLGSFTNIIFNGEQLTFITSSLPFTVQIVTNALVAAETNAAASGPAFGYTQTVSTNLPAGPAVAVTNGTPPELISPTLTLLDPARQTRLDLDAGPLGVTNQVPLSALTNGCLFTVPDAYAGDYCFLNVNQVISNAPPAFSAVVYQPPATNLTVATTVSNLTDTVVTRQTFSNVWFNVSYLGPTNSGLLPPEDVMVIVSSNLIVETTLVTVTNTAVTPLAYTATNAVITEGSNHVTYTYNRTQYTLNYRLWEPGTVAFSPAAARVSESAASVRLTVSRSGGTAGAVNLRYRFEDADTPDRDYEARDGEDFLAAAGELFWADGQGGSTNITVALVQDLRPVWEGDERFAVVLEAHEDAEYRQAALGADATAVVTLLESAKPDRGTFGFAGSSADEAGPPAPFANPAKPAVTVTEGDALTLWVGRSGGSDGVSRVRVTAANGSARAPADFEPLDQLLEWGHGETEPQPVTLQTLARDGFNPDAALTVRLARDLNATLAGATAVSVTLRDAEAALSLADTAAAAAARGAAFRALAGLWFWGDPETLRAAPAARAGAARLSLTLTGPGVLSFDWGMNGWSAPDTLACAGGVLARKTLDAPAGAAELLVKPGRQTVTWTYTRATAPGGDAPYPWLANLVWRPLTRAASPSPAHQSRAFGDAFAWQLPDTYAVRLGGDFEVDAGAGLVQTATVRAVSPAGAALPDAVGAAFEELWGAAAPTPGRAYRWRVDTLYAHADGTLAAAGDTWSFTALDPDGSDATGLPPDGLQPGSGAYEALQGVRCDFGAISDDPGLTYALAGGALPPGLALDRATGRIAGVPARAGAWNARLQATSTASGARVPYATADLAFLVRPLDAFAGTYTGWIRDETAAPCAGGTATLTLNAAGRLTAAFTAAGGAYRFSAAAFDAADDVAAPTLLTLDAVAGGSVTDSARARHTHTLEDLTLAADGTGTATLTLYTLVKTGAATEAVPAVYTVTLFLNRWTDPALQPALDALRGYYTAALPVADARDPDNTPWGSGTLALTVGANGSVKASGVLADGQPWSLATTLLLPDTNDAATASVFLYAQPSAYAKQGGFCGLARLSAADTPYANTLDAPDPGLHWWNATPTSVLGATGTVAGAGSGFFNTLDAAGGFYDTVMNLQTYYLRKTLSFEDAAAFPGTPALDRLPEDADGRNGASGYLLLSDDLFLPFGTAVTAGAKSLAAPARHVVSNDLDSAENPLADCIEADASANVSGLTLALTRATGLLAGAFDLVYERQNANGAFVRRTRRVAFKGVHTPVRPDNDPLDPALGSQGGGFYLIPDTGAYLDDTGRTRSYGFNWSFAFELLAVEAGDAPGAD